VRDPSPLQLLDLGHEQHALAISADGSLFATAGVDMTVRLWDLATAALLAEGSGHSATVRAVAFAPDGKQLVSAGDDGSVLIWNIFYL
jgi:WD40 repeat protein